MGLFYKAKQGHRMDFTLELKPDWYTDIHQETRDRFLAPEWFPQSGVELIWPTAETDWEYMLNEVTECYIRMAYEIARRERLLIVTSHKGATTRLLRERLPAEAMKNIWVADCPINDTWARDSGVITVCAPTGMELWDLGFNGWGGKFEAALDNRINRTLYHEGMIQGEYRGCKDFVLEGGSIETDGKGTLLTTESCLLTPTRNPGLGKADIELKLKRMFNLREVLWLKHGKLIGDDTDGHIDTLARLCPRGTIAYVECRDTADAHYRELSLMKEELEAFRQDSGEPYRLVALPLPAPIFDHDNGERLPATYANFLVLNDAVLVPAYGQPENDRAAAKAIADIYNEREIVSVPATALIRQHGSIHCCAMQLPAGVMTHTRNT